MASCRPLFQKDSVRERKGSEEMFWHASEEIRRAPDSKGVDAIINTMPYTCASKRDVTRK